MGFNPPRAQRIGNLRHKIQWQELVADGSGGWNPTEKWVDRGKEEPARVEPLKGGEQFNANEKIALQNVRVFARFRHVPDTAKWRVLWITGNVIDGVPERFVLDILATSNPDERRRFVELLCENTRSQADAPAS